MKNMSMKHETKNTRMGSRTSMIQRNTAPTRVDSTTASTIWMASSTLAYSQRLLYRWNSPSTATLMQCEDAQHEVDLVVDEHFALDVGEQRCEPVRGVRRDDIQQQQDRCAFCDMSVQTGPRLE